MDENGIPKETREEMLLRVSVIVPRLLSKYDKNKDGTIDIHELGHLLKDMNGSNRFPPSTQIASVMDQLDVDGNGHVTTDEFVNWYVYFKGISLSLSLSLPPSLFDSHTHTHTHTGTWSKNSTNENARVSASQNSNRSVHLERGERSIWEAQKVLPVRISTLRRLKMQLK